MFSNTKIKIFSTYYKKSEEVETEVNEFCKGKEVISIQFTDVKVMVVYKEN